MKRPALQNKQVGVLQMAFRARNVFGTLEKRAPGSFDRRHLDETTLRATALDLRSEDYEPKTQTVSTVESPCCYPSH